MTIDLTKEQLDLQERVRALARSEFAPKASHWDATETFPIENMDRLADEGLRGILTPRECGGAGLGALEMAIVLEELAAACVATADALHNSVTISQLPLVRYGTEEQKRKYLVPAAAGKTINAFSLTEPHAGSDAAAITTTAEPCDGGWVLNGFKQFATLSGVADAIFVAAKTDAGISLFIVEKGSNGLIIGKRTRLMGQRGLDTGDITLENCFVPRENLLGKEGEGLRECLQSINVSRIGAAALSVGIARQAMQQSIHYAKNRVAFGKPVSDLQAIQFMIADAATDIDAARMLVYRAGRLADSGKNYIQEAAMAKLFASTMVRRHTMNAIDIHGGSGYVRDTGVERLHRDCILFGIAGGTAPVMRLAIAKQVIDRTQTG